MTSIRRHSAADLERFLRELDAELSARIDGPLELVIIGGAAAALAYQFEQATADIDLCHPIEPTVAQAAAVVRRRTGLAIPIQHAATFDAPWSYEDRLRDLEVPGLTHLRLRVPAPEDLIVMKLMRGVEHDLVAAEAITRTENIALESLLARMRETDHAIGPPAVRRLNFLAAIARIFGGDAADEIGDPLE
jgi:hypothetical protein